MRALKLVFSQIKSFAFLKVSGPEPKKDVKIVLLLPVLEL